MINIISVGKNMPTFIESGFKEYQKRLSSYHQIALLEINNSKYKNLPANELMIAEAKLIQAKIGKNSFTVCLDKSGNKLSSEALANKINQWQEISSTINFIIGGAYGLTTDILKAADFTLSLSPLTLPHNLVRLILAEQIYRAYTILNRHPYHK